MWRMPSCLMVIAPGVLAVLGGMAIAAQDKYTVQVPNGLAFSEAFLAGVPGNGKHFPDGSKLAKITWMPKQNVKAPFTVSVPDTLMGVGFMVKDSKKFSATGGWGYAQFDYDPASGTFRPNTSKQGNDATCGAECHSIVKAQDFVFTAYSKR